MKDWVGDCCGVGFVGLEDEEEAFVVGCDEGCEGGDFLEGLVVFYVGEFEGTDERGQALGAEAMLLSDRASLYWGKVYGP